MATDIPDGGNSLTFDLLTARLRMRMRLLFTLRRALIDPPNAVQAAKVSV